MLSIDEKDEDGISDEVFELLSISVHRHPAIKNVVDMPDVQELHPEEPTMLLNVMPN